MNEKQIQIKLDEIKKELHFRLNYVYRHICDVDVVYSDEGINLHVNVVRFSENRNFIIDLENVTLTLGSDSKVFFNTKTIEYDSKALTEF